jgi:hypothetical protein
MKTVESTKLEICMWRAALFFPTAGFANPTLTIVALAIRLADHLKQILKA